ncbi:MAG: hypothetical protein V4808_16055 [Pseudomonadota bacterium]
MQSGRSNVAIQYLFDRIPALSELRGVARLNAEDVIENAIADAIDDYLADCEMVAMTGAAP